MRDHDPRALDRPKLAEALASLKEGLRDTADPFFDGWKLPPAAAAVAGVVEAAAQGAADTIEQSALDEALHTDLCDAPPGGLTFGGAEATSSEALATSSEARVPPRDELDAPTLEIAKVRFASAPESLAVSSLRDTIRVRIVEYPVFPRWALVAAAALLVFAASVVALKLAYQPTARAAVLPAHEATAAPAEVIRPVEVTPAALADSSLPSSSTPSAPVPMKDRSRDPPTHDATGKSREPKPRASDFFRDPGF